jgi:hypothetical protein
MPLRLRSSSYFIGCDFFSNTDLIDKVSTFETQSNAPGDRKSVYET